MNATFSLPFHSLSILLVGITAGLVYANFSITQTRHEAAQKARRNPITSVLNDNKHTLMWDNRLQAGEYVLLQKYHR